MRQAYDYWQDQPGSTQRAALQGRQNTKRVSHPRGKQRRKHCLASELRHMSMTQLQGPLRFSRNHQIRGRMQLDSVSVHAVLNTYSSKRVEELIIQSQLALKSKNLTKGTRKWKLWWLAEGSLSVDKTRRPKS